MTFSGIGAKGLCPFMRINFYSPWNHQKTFGFPMISEEIEVNRLNSLNKLTLSKSKNIISVHKLMELYVILKLKTLPGFFHISFLAAPMSTLGQLQGDSPLSPDTI